MATDQQGTETSAAGLSRRQVLARGAVAAGVVWAAPVIRTATAYATSAAGTERPCTKFYLVCIDKLGPRPVRFLDSNDRYDEMPADSVLARFRPVDELPTTTTSTSTTSSTTASSTSSTTTTSTSSTSTTTTSSTTTTTTTRPFRDPTAGTGVFPGDESTSGSTPKSKHKKKKKKPGEPESTTTTTTTTTPDGLTPDESAAATPAPGDDLGLFSNPNAPAAADTTVVPVADVLPDGIKKWLDDNSAVPLRYPDIPPMLTQTGDDAWAVLLPAVKGGPDPSTHQCRGVKGWAQAGDHDGEFYVDPNALGDEQGLRLIFPNPTDKPGAIERLFLVYCCP